MLESTTDRREKNRNNILLSKTTVEEEPIQTNRTKGSSSNRFCAETAQILEEKYNEHIKIYTDCFKKDEKVECAVISPDQKFRKRLKPQKKVYSAEQEAIIKAIYVFQRTGERRVIITDSKIISKIIRMT
jgi:type I restriction-modification system DNA methylase subunit